MTYSLPHLDSLPPSPSTDASALDVSSSRTDDAGYRAKNADYRAILDSIDAGFCVIEMLFDAQGRGTDYIFVETNASFEKTTGLVNAVGSRMREFAPCHEQHWFDIYGEVALTGKPVRFEQEARALHRWYSVYAFRIGKPEDLKVAVLFEDVTARKKADQRRVFLAEISETISYLREEAAIVRAVVRALGGFLDVDRCFFAELTDDGGQVMLGENYLRGAPPGFAGSMDLGQFGGLEFWHRLSRSETIVEDVTIHPLTQNIAEVYVRFAIRSFIGQPFKEAGRVTLLLVVSESSPRQWSPDEAKLVEDVVARVWPVVERVRSERELIAAHAELEQHVVERTAKLQAAVSELETYSYSISHDLRAPLRAMQTYAGILTEECGDRIGDEGRDYLHRIMSASERMDRLIRDVLVFSQAAHANTALERVELAPLVAAVIETYPGLNAAKADIEVVAPMAPVQANQAALTQCLANLLGNAIKFVPPGVSPKARVWTEAEDDRVRLYVRDNGVGIPRELHEKIFGVFYRDEPARDDTGTGIGLAIVRKAVERMGGRVGLESAPGKGSTFWLDLKHSPDD